MISVHSMMFQVEYLCEKQFQICVTGIFPGTSFFLRRRIFPHPFFPRYYKGCAATNNAHGHEVSWRLSDLSRAFRWNSTAFFPSSNLFLP